MKQYRVEVNKQAKADFRKCISYIQKVFKNPQAAKSLVDDFRETKESLKQIAGSLKEPDSEKLRSRGLRRLNFKRHDYFLLYTIVENRAIITKVFHASEDFENKLN